MCRVTEEPTDKEQNSFRSGKRVRRSNENVQAHEREEGLYYKYNPSLEFKNHITSYGKTYNRKLI